MSATRATTSEPPFTGSCACALPAASSTASAPAIHHFSSPAERLMFFAPRLAILVGRKSMRQRSRLSSADRRQAIPPRHFLFKNTAEAEQHRLVAAARHELDPDRQAFGRPVERQRNGGLARYVERVHERRIRPFAIVRVEIGLRHVEMAERARRLR